LVAGLAARHRISEVGTLNVRGIELNAEAGRSLGEWSQATIAVQRSQAVAAVYDAPRFEMIELPRAHVGIGHGKSFALTIKLPASEPGAAICGDRRWPARRGSRCSPVAPTAERGRTLQPEPEAMNTGERNYFGQFDASGARASLCCNDR
jgi:hypothetical protein